MDPELTAATAIAADAQTEIAETTAETAVEIAAIEAEARVAIARADRDAAIGVAEAYAEGEDQWRRMEERLNAQDQAIQAVAASVSELAGALLLTQTQQPPPEPEPEPEPELEAETLEVEASPPSGEAGGPPESHEAPKVVVRERRWM